MKKTIKYICSYLVALLSISLSAQTQSENYIERKTYKVKAQSPLNTNDPNKVIKTIQYFDGLGRLKQSVVMKGGSLNYGSNGEILAKDIVTLHEYDNFGRQVKEYLPYASINTDGRFETSAKNDIENYYFNNYGADFPNAIIPSDVNAYAEKVLERSPLNRIFERSAPGEEWNKGVNLISGKEYSDGHTIKMDYETNSTLDQVKLFNVTTTFSNSTYIPTLSGGTTFYDMGELVKVITKDENWVSTDGTNHTIEEYTDKNGLLILKRTYAAFDLNSDGDTNDLGESSVAHDTYHVYDDFGNLTYILPPNASSQTITQTVLDNLCYQYVYDHRNRMVEKKIPGKGWEYIVYDKLDRPILTQDVLQRNKSPKEWLLTKYDAFGRIAYTGLYESNASRNSLQTNVNSAAGFETQTLSISSNLMGGEEVFYTYVAYPNTQSITPYKINYYDTYVDLPTGFTPPTTVYGQLVTSNTKGLATISKTRIIGTSNWITTVTYYDDEARPIYIYSKNDYLQTTDIVESKLDFTGKIVERKTTHNKVGIGVDIVTIDRFEYDHMDRLINQSQIINNNPAERIFRNNYDDLGQLESKLTGNGIQNGYTDVTNGVNISGGIISKTSGSCWYEGLATSGSFQEDGYIEYTYNDDSFFMVGLSDSNVNAVWTTIDYAIYHEGTGIVIYENATHKGSFGQVQLGDVFRVERIGNKVYYKRNGDIFYTSATSSIGTLLGDISLCGDGDPIKDLYIVDNSKGLQNIDYAYNIRGWLKKINQDSHNDNDLFNFSLHYNDPVNGGTALYNGNISQANWNTSNTNTSTQTYNYSYDALDRITSGILSSTDINHNNKHNLKLVEYDKNGNILKLRRNGYRSDGVFDEYLDYMSYYYSGNQLTGILEQGHHYEGFSDGAHTATNDYTYDANGNIISDANKRIATIEYNHLNLPTQITFEIPLGSSGQRTIEYIYDASGVKLKKRINDFVNGNGSLTEISYAGNYVYEKVISSNSNGSDKLQYFNHAEGYIKPVFIIAGKTAQEQLDSFDYVYQYKDHLGNVRLSYADSDDDGQIDRITCNGTCDGRGLIDLDGDGDFVNEIIKENNYYPFGLEHKGYNNVISSNGNSIAQKRLYNGKEYQTGLGLNWYDYGARNYDPAIARWMNIDPAAELFVDKSPFNYGNNNPIFFIDPNGMWTVSIISSTDPTTGYKSYSLSFTAQKGDNVESLSKQLGIPVEELLFWYPELKDSIEEGKSYGLEYINYINDINNTINTAAVERNQKNWNCANLAAGECSDLKSQWDNVDDNLDDFVNDLTSEYDNVKEANTRIGTVVHYTINKNKEIKRMTDIIRKRMKKDGVPDVQINAYLNKPHVKAFIESKVTMQITGERHFSVVVLKSPDGTKIQNIIQKSGQLPFSLKVDKASDVGNDIPYEATPIKTGGTPYFNKKEEK